MTVLSRTISPIGTPSFTPTQDDLPDRFAGILATPNDLSDRFVGDLPTPIAPPRDVIDRAQAHLPVGFAPDTAAIAGQVVISRGLE